MKRNWTQHRVSVRPPFGPGVHASFEMTIDGDQDDDLIAQAEAKVSDARAFLAAMFPGSLVSSLRTVQDYDR